MSIADFHKASQHRDGAKNAPNLKTTRLHWCPNVCAVLLGPDTVRNRGMRRVHQLSCFGPNFQGVSRTVVLEAAIRLCVPLPSFKNP